MISISNADRDKVVEYLRAYASTLQIQGMHTTKQFNERRMALNLAKKLELKKPLPVESTPDREQTRPKKVIIK